MGMGVGIWLGTKYDCKPYIVFFAKFIAENIPKERE